MKLADFHYKKIYEPTIKKNTEIISQSLNENEIEIYSQKITLNDNMKKLQNEVNRAAEGNSVEEIAAKGIEELEPEEYDLVHEGQILYTYLHLASNPKFAKYYLYS